MVAEAAKVTDGVISHWNITRIVQGQSGPQMKNYVRITFAL